LAEAPAPPPEQQWPRPITLPSLQGQVRAIVRHDPSHLRSYFERVASAREVIRARAQEQGGVLGRWDEKLINSAWKSVLMGTSPLMEVFPIATASAFRSSYVSEVNMHLLNAKSQVDSESRDCYKLFTSLRDITITEANKEILEKVKECVAGAEFRVRQAAILSLYAIEFVHRKAQFSLPLRQMPNSAKGVAGIWTD
jgi:hypothetical protein